MPTWRERIAEMGVPTLRDADQIADWTTCAVGEQHQAHPNAVIVYGEYGGPVDLSLANAGLQICDVICLAWGARRPIDRAAADRVLDDIEARVLELKREAGSHEGAS